MAQMTKIDRAVEITLARFHYRNAAVDFVAATAATKEQYTPMNNAHGAVNGAVATAATRLWATHSALHTAYNNAEQAYFAALELMIEATTEVGSNA